MKSRSLALVFFFLLTIDPLNFIFGKPLSKFTTRKPNTESIEDNYPRYMEKKDEYDTYMILYFLEDLNYSESFNNSYRENISYILNRKDNAKFKAEEKIEVDKGFGIEIHFDKPVNSLNNFFSSFYDGNMEYLESIDFSNFDSSLVTDMSHMFDGCISLKSINILNLNTSLVTDTSFMFSYCTSLESLNLSILNFSSALNLVLSFLFIIKLIFSL